MNENVLRARGLTIKKKSLKRAFKIFGITEIILSILLGSFGIIEFIIGRKDERSCNRYQSSYDWMYRDEISCYPADVFTFFEGLWCAIPVLISGILSVCVGCKSRNKQSLTIASLIFSILGAIANGGLFLVELILIPASTYPSPGYLVVSSSIVFLSFSCMLLLVTTSVLCSCLMKCCCGNSTRINETTREFEGPIPLTRRETYSTSPMEMPVDATVLAPTYS